MSAKDLSAAGARQILSAAQKTRVLVLGDVFELNERLTWRRTGDNYYL
jgi:hypothetical protein